eukprot:5036052-Pyramimonas_sp.AAC.1
MPLDCATRSLPQPACDKWRRRPGIPDRPCPPRRCSQSWGHIPNWILVDFYEIGDVFTVVDAINNAHDSKEAFFKSSTAPTFSPTSPTELSDTSTPTTSPSGISPAVASSGSPTAVFDSHAASGGFSVGALTLWLAGAAVLMQTLVRL